MTTFETSFHRLQEIKELLAGQSIVDIDKILVLQTEAKVLYEYCTSRVKKAEKQSAELAVE